MCGICFIGVRVFVCLFCWGFIWCLFPKGRNNEKPLSVWTFKVYMIILIIFNVFSVKKTEPLRVFVSTSEFLHTPEKHCWLISAAQLLCFNSCNQIKYSSHCCCYSQFTRRIKSGKVEENKLQFAQHYHLTDSIFRSCDNVAFLASGVFFIHLVCSILLKFSVYFNSLQFFINDCLKFISKSHKVTCQLAEKSVFCVVESLTFFML